MPAVKKITIDWSETGKTTYCIIRREVDGYLLNDADGDFANAPADPFITLTEDGTIKGRYELSESRAVWNDGAYSVAIYKQAGGSPDPASDTIIGSGQMSIVSDAEVINVLVSDKTGFSLSATGADLILKSSTFVQAIVAAINEFATYGLTALNTLLVTTGIKAATVSDKTGYSLSVTPPTAATIADAVWDEAIADHTTGTTFGGKNQKVVPSETINDYKATGFSTHSAADVVTELGDGSTLTACATATGFATVGDLGVVQTGDTFAALPTNFSDLSITNTTGLVAVADTQKVDVNTIKTQTVTCAAGVTVAAYVGTAAQDTAQTGDSYAIVNGDHGLVSIQDDIDAIVAGVITNAAGADVAADIIALKAVADLNENILRNKMEVVDATGAVTLYADDNSTPLLTGTVSDDSTTTTRTRLS